MFRPRSLQILNQRRVQMRRAFEAVEPNPSAIRQIAKVIVSASLRKLILTGVHAFR